MSLGRLVELSVRSFLVLFIDIILAKRHAWLYELKRLCFPSLSTDSLPPPKLSDEYTTLAIAFVFTLFVIACVLDRRSNVTLALVCCPFLLTFVAYIIFVRRLNAIIAKPTAWHTPTILASLSPLPFLGYLTSFTCFRLLSYKDPMPRSNMASTIALRNALRTAITLCMIFLPAFLFLSAHKLSDTVDLLIHSPLGSCVPRANYSRTCDAVCAYFNLLVESPLSAAVDERVWRHYAPCMLFHSASKIIYQELFTFPQIFLSVFISLIILALLMSGLWSHLLRRVDEQWRYLSTDPFEYLHMHWVRLEVPKVFLLFWIIKLVLVLVLGENFWPIDATVVELVSRPIEGQDAPIRYSLNFTFLGMYANENSLTLSAWSRFQSRLLTGVLALGSETWTSVYGAAVFLGLLSAFLVKVLAFFVDPLGETTAQLAETAEADPVAANPWAPIEDQLQNNNHIEVTAIELLNNTGWSCVVLFAFLAIQYDLPNLSIHQRVFCFMHLFIVMGFTCIYPVESLVKAILLRLGIPGQESAWLDHLIPLTFCGLMFAVSGCVFVYFPTWLSYLPHTGRGYQFLAEISGATSEGTLKPPAVFSAYSSYAQRLRTYLCGGQLLLDVTCTLIEYLLHQVHKRKPNWTGFGTLLAATRLTNIFINYLISLLSVLIILWLIFYESFGVCRVFILVVHVSCVLYPATYRGLSWLRWRFLFSRSLSQIPSPTEEELEINADDCPICFSAMSATDAKLTRCGHIYHTDCLSQWMRRQSFCPVCNSDLFSSSVKSTRILTSIANQRPEDSPVAS
uniref:ERAD-associated E3 ubiquitin-protein ligase HRD1B n=2 Tax=Schistocephalus solidus TaxID=70667 RepID=A0A0X3NRW8_SCHSO